MKWSPFVCCYFLLLSAELTLSNSELENKLIQARQKLIAHRTVYQEKRAEYKRLYGTVPELEQTAARAVEDAIDSAKDRDNKNLPNQKVVDLTGEEVIATRNFETTKEVVSKITLRRQATIPLEIDEIKKEIKAEEAKRDAEKKKWPDLEKKLSSKLAEEKSLSKKINMESYNYNTAVSTITKNLCIAASTDSECKDALKVRNDYDKMGSDLAKIKADVGRITGELNLAKNEFGNAEEKIEALEDEYEPFHAMVEAEKKLNSVKAMLSRAKSYVQTNPVDITQEIETANLAKIEEMRAKTELEQTLQRMKALEETIERMKTDRGKVEALYRQAKREHKKAIEQKEKENATNAVETLSWSNMNRVILYCIIFGVLAFLVLAIPMLILLNLKEILEYFENKKKKTGVSEVPPIISDISNSQNQSTKPEETETNPFDLSLMGDLYHNRILAVYKYEENPQVEIEEATCVEPDYDDLYLIHKAYRAIHATSEEDATMRAVPSLKQEAEEEGVLKRGKR